MSESSRECPTCKTIDSLYEDESESFEVDDKIISAGPMRRQYRKSGVFQRQKSKRDNLLIGIDEPDVLQYFVVYQYCLKVLVDQVQRYISTYVHADQTDGTTCSPGDGSINAEGQGSLSLMDRVKDLWFRYLSQCQEKHVGVHDFLKRATKPAKRANRKGKRVGPRSFPAAAGAAGSGSGVQVAGRKRGRPVGPYIASQPAATHVLPTKPLLLGFVYLALRLTRNQCVLPSDLVRLCEHGHVGYSTLWSTLPLEMKAAVGIKYKRVLGRDVQGGGNIATVHTIDYHASLLAEFLGIPMPPLNAPLLVAHMQSALQLPGCVWEAYTRLGCIWDTKLPIPGLDPFTAYHAVEIAAWVLVAVKCCSVTADKGRDKSKSKGKGKGRVQPCEPYSVTDDVFWGKWTLEHLDLHLGQISGTGTASSEVVFPLHTTLSATQLSRYIARHPQHKDRLLAQYVANLGRVLKPMSNLHIYQESDVGGGREFASSAASASSAAAATRDGADTSTALREIDLLNMMTFGWSHRSKKSKRKSRGAYSSGESSGDYSGTGESEDTVSSGGDTDTDDSNTGARSRGRGGGHVGGGGAVCDELLALQNEQLAAVPHYIKSSRARGDDKYNRVVVELYSSCSELHAALPAAVTTPSGQNGCGSGPTPTLTPESAQPCSSAATSEGCVWSSTSVSYYCPRATEREGAGVLHDCYAALLERFALFMGVMPADLLSAVDRIEGLMMSHHAHKVDQGAKLKEGAKGCLETLGVDQLFTKNQRVTNSETGQLANGGGGDGGGDGGEMQRYRTHCDSFMPLLRKLGGAGVLENEEFVIPLTTTTTTTSSGHGTTVSSVTTTTTTTTTTATKVQTQKHRRHNSCILSTSEDSDTACDSSNDIL